MCRQLGAVGRGHNLASSELEIKNTSTSAGFAITTGNTTDDGYINFNDGAAAWTIYISTVTTICVFMSTQLSGCASIARNIIWANQHFFKHWVWRSSGHGG